MHVPEQDADKQGTNLRKRTFTSITEKNRTVDRILKLLEEHQSFLLLGHEFPDEDCIASLVSMALIIQKFGKHAGICLHKEIPSQLSFLTGICAYNKIPVIVGSFCMEAPPEVICILDTPKPAMVAMNPKVAAILAGTQNPVIEFDHHLSADAEYNGSPGYCLVNRASSTCELLGFFCYKLAERRDLLVTYGIKDLFSRNLVLSLLTGMIADTRFGQTLKTHRDKFFYALYANRFARILQNTKYKNSGNYDTMTAIFKSIQLLTVAEQDIYQQLVDRARISGKTGFIVLDLEESLNYLDRVEYGLFLKVIKSVTDYLSEKSGAIGLTAYYDPPDTSDLVQFRVRTARGVTGMDLRSLLADFSITDGGGHPGAIAFRIPKKELTDLRGFVKRLLERLESL